MSDAPRRKSRAGILLERLEADRTLAPPRFDKDEAEHRYRGRVVIAVFAMLIAELSVITVAWLGFRVEMSALKDMAAIILTPTFTLFGTIIGFYFSRGR